MLDDDLCLAAVEATALLLPCNDLLHSSRSSLRAVSLFKLILPFESEKISLFSFSSWSILLMVFLSACGITMDRW